MSVVIECTRSSVHDELIEHEEHHDCLTTLTSPSFSTLTSTLRSPSYSTLVSHEREGSLFDGSDTQSLQTLAADARPKEPRYTFGAAPKPDQLSHSFQLRSSKNRKPWASFFIEDPEMVGTRGLKKIVKVMGGDAVSGLVELDLETPQAITSIKFNIKAKLLTGFLSEFHLSILDHSYTVWDRSYGDPRLEKGNNKLNGKLSKGVYHFPFSFRIPNHTNTTTLAAADDEASLQKTDSGSVSQTPKKGTIFRWNKGSPRGDDGIAAEQEVSTSTRVHGSFEGDGTGDVHVLPPSFRSRGTNANIEYVLSLCISHGKLRGDSKLRVPMYYIPSVQPIPSPVKRFSSFQYSSPLTDPKGWVELPPITVSGTIANEKDVDFECGLWLSQPLSYSRGTVISCFMTISSDDVEALDLVATPESLHVRLSRTVNYSINGKLWDSSLMAVHTSIREITGAHMANVAQSVFEIVGSAEEANDKSTVPDGEQIRAYGKLPSLTGSVPVESAIWWLPPQDEEFCSPTLRVFQGEIHLVEDLYPTSLFPNFLIRYAVEMLPFDCPSFQPTMPTPESSPKKSKGKGPSIKVPYPRKRPYLRREVTIASVPRLDEPTAIAFTDRPTENRRLKVMDDPVSCLTLDDCLGAATTAFGGAMRNMAI
ncbi:hypothetical protein CC2G_013965 [Coprinopsis cinerea AmutBmut pab1-1]|nr:hypothetical protein CC2G_013965 [Coprinopsis cinerea AmutBmut pab1-1]